MQLDLHVKHTQDSSIHVLVIKIAVGLLNINNCIKQKIRSPSMFIVYKKGHAVIIFNEPYCRFLSLR